jgi:hypothetical protein
VLRTVVLLNAPAAGTLRTILLFKSEAFFLVGAAGGSMVFLLEDRIGFDRFEFSLEVTDGITMGATIGTATTVGKVISVVLGFFADMAPSKICQYKSPNVDFSCSIPISFTSTFFLHFLWVHIDVTGLRKVAR